MTLEKDETKRDSALKRNDMCIVKHRVRAYATTGNLVILFRA